MHYKKEIFITSDYYLSSLVLIVASKYTKTNKMAVHRNHKSKDIVFFCKMKYNSIHANRMHRWTDGRTDGQTYTLTHINTKN